MHRIQATLHGRTFVPRTHCPRHPRKSAACQSSSPTKRRSRTQPDSVNVYRVPPQTRPKTTSAAAAHHPPFHLRQRSNCDPLGGPFRRRSPTSWRCCSNGWCAGAFTRCWADDYRFRRVRSSPTPVPSSCSAVFGRPFIWITSRFLTSRNQYWTAPTGTKSGTANISTGSKAGDGNRRPRVQYNNIDLYTF